MPALLCRWPSLSGTTKRQSFRGRRAFQIAAGRSNLARALDRERRGAVRRTVPFKMAKSGPVFCIRVNGLQVKPPSDELTQDLKSWSWFTESSPNGDIVYRSTDQVVPPTADLLKRLNAEGVRHQYYRRIEDLDQLDLLNVVIEEPGDVVADAIPHAVKGDRFRLGIWNGEFQKLSFELRSKINAEADERDYISPGIHFFMFSWSASIRLTAIVIELTHVKREYSVHFLPDGGAN